MNVASSLNYNMIQYIEHQKPHKNNHRTIQFIWSFRTQMLWFDFWKHRTSQTSTCYISLYNCFSGNDLKLYRIAVSAAKLYLTHEEICTSLTNGSYPCMTPNWAFLDPIPITSITIHLHGSPDQGFSNFWVGSC